MQDYRIIFPGGDRSTLTVMLVFYYEEDDWALASRENFGQDEDRAWEYCYALAEEHGLEVRDDRPGHGQRYLD